MKVKCLMGDYNTGLLSPYKKSGGKEFDYVTIKKGRYIYNDGKIIYWLNGFGNHSKYSGMHIGFSWKEHQKFLWMQKEHWLQKEDNIRFIVNALFLIIGVYIALKQM